MPALRENPQDRVYRELAEQFPPANAFWNGQVEELAGLYGDLHREQRVQTALLLRGLQELEAKQRVRRAEVVVSAPRCSTATPPKKEERSRNLL